MNASTSSTRTGGEEPPDTGAVRGCREGGLSRTARTRARRTIRSPRRRAFPPPPAPSAAEAAATRAAQAAAISAVAQHRTAAATEPHDVARAWRMRAVHAPVSNHHRCGLCLSAWPCPPRSWAENTLRAAHALDAAG
jgi:hypothetical protein